MNITNPIDYIRQQQFGRFRRPEDGTEPYTHVNDQKLGSLKGQDERSIYVNNEKIITFEKDLAGSGFPKLFDSNAGLKLEIGKIGETKKEDKLQVQYDKTGKEQKLTYKQESVVDQWA